MIPAGLTPADDRRAAEIFGVALDTFQKSWATRGLKPVSRQGAARRIWILEQLLAVRDGLPVPPVPAQPDPMDLLDYEELRESLPPVRLDLVDGQLRESDPPMRRPARETWKTLRRDGKAPTPDIPADDQDRGVGTDLYYRRTGELWNANRRGRGGGPGRPVGARDSRPRSVGSAEQRLDRVRVLLAERPGITAAQLGRELEVSEEHARRLRARVRGEAGS